MGFTGTFFPFPIKMLLALSLMGLLTACEIDDTVLCDDTDASLSETCPGAVPGSIVFKVHYTTANGNRPDGRYGYVPTGAATTDAMAEAEAKGVIQYVFNTVPAYLIAETAEIAHYRGNICGHGFVLQRGLGDFRVTNVRRTGANTFDYDLELTCTN